MAPKSRKPSKAVSKKKGVKRPLQFRSEALAQALERQDMAAVAFALRNGNTVVPLKKAADKDRPLEPGEIWTYRDPATEEVALLLFSDAAHKPANLPPAVGLQSPQWLASFLTVHADEITTVFLDIAGPHPMQASPADLLAALGPLPVDFDSVVFEESDLDDAVAEVEAAGAAAVADGDAADAAGAVDASADDAADTESDTDTAAGNEPGAAGKTPGSPEV